MELQIVNFIMDTLFITSYFIILYGIVYDKNKKEKHQKYFLAIIVAVMIHTILDLLFCILNGVEGITALQYIIATGSLIVYYVCSFGFLCYLLKIFDNTMKTKKVQLILQCYSILFFTFLLLIIIFTITGDLYSYNNGYYVKGKNLYVSQIFPLLVYLGCVILSIFRKQTLRNKLINFAFCISPIIGTIVVLALSDISISSLYMFISIIAIYTNIYNEKNVELYEKNLELINSKMDVMMSQIQPHFLYNTITTAMALCDTDPKQAKKTIGEFGKYLRTNLNSLKIKTPVPFLIELKHIETYVGLEKQRFMDKLEVEYHINCVDFELPVLSIQPLVENAIKHGIIPKVQGGKVIISTFEDNKNNYVTIEDNGIGFDKMKNLEGVHIGLKNITSRLDYMVNGKIEIDSTIGVGTTIKVTIPKKRK